MILFSSPASPFGRKVKIAAKLLGLWDRLTVIVADTLDPADPLRSQNPLGKIPTLVLDDGTALYDSRVIVQYLQELAGGEALLPKAGLARIMVLRGEALADGIQDAALLQVMEVRFRDAAKHEPKWLSHQADKVTRGLAYLEQNLPSEKPDLAAVATACALGYLDLRFSGTWRAAQPKLAAWLARFEAQVPGFEETKVK